MKYESAPFASLARVYIKDSYARNLRAAQKHERPAAVHPEVWERYERSIPWISLNVGLIGMVLAEPRGEELMRSAAEGFWKRQDPLWLVAELLLSHGDRHAGTVDGDTIQNAAAGVALETIYLQRDGRRRRVDDGRMILMPRSAIGALIATMARDQVSIVLGGDSFPDDSRRGGQEPLTSFVRSIRSADPVTDRRLSHLRAIAGRALSSRKNQDSLRSLIWESVAASVVNQSEAEIASWMLGAEPLLDPVTLAAGLLVVWNADDPDAVLQHLRTRGLNGRPRGWPDDLDLGLGRDAFSLYVQMLETRLRKASRAST